MAAEIYIRFYEELSDFLPPDKIKTRFTYPLGNIRTVKELLHGLSVPEKVVELVLIDGASVDFSCQLKDKDFVSVYPVFESLDVRSLVRVREDPLRRTRFILSAGLIRLGRYLNLLGFDALEAQSWPLKKIVRVAEKERRILLTRDLSLFNYRELSRIYLVRAAEPKNQLREILSRFDLYDAIHFSGTQPLLAGLLTARAESK